MVELVAPGRLREFFAPRSIAIVGASDTSGWTRFVVAGSRSAGFGGPLIPVHPSHRTVFGRPAVASLRDLAEPVDLAFIMAPADAVEGVLDDAAAAGVRNAIVLASGYREVGEPGRAREDRLVALAARNGITLLGPNCLGFINAHAKAAPFALTVPPSVPAGPVGIALQSGALAGVVLAFAHAHAIGVSTLATMGNEAMIATTDVLEYLVDDDATRVICLFLEQISDPVRFGAAAERANRAGKPVVVLKVGASQAGQQAALAHTGAIAGDDAVVGAVLRQLNVIRVTSLEEMLSTAAALGYSRWPAGRRMGVVTTSGGACDLIADRATAEAIEIPPFAPGTAAAISPHVPPFAAVRNPIDVTGYFLANQRTEALTAVDHVLDAVVADPGIDFVLFTGMTVPDARPEDEVLAGMLAERARWLAERIASAPVPVIPVGHTCVNLSPYARELLGGNGIHMLPGIDLGMTALGHALRWLENAGRAAPGGLARGRPGLARAAEGFRGVRGGCPPCGCGCGCGCGCVVRGRRAGPAGQLWRARRSRRTRELGGRSRGRGPPSRPAGRAQGLLRADRAQVRRWRRRGRACHRGRGPSRVRAGTGRRRRGFRRPDRRRAGQPHAHRRGGAHRRGDGRPRLRPGARGRARRRVGGGAGRHQPAAAAGGSG
jgi:acyl-CoA synthetase (NDP forming)